MTVKHEELKYAEYCLRDAQESLGAYSGTNVSDYEGQIALLNKAANDLLRAISAVMRATDS